MEGRYPPAIMLTLAHCSDPDHVEDWLDWYAHIHTPDVTSAGVFTDMIRFMNTDTDHQGRQIANLSETDFADPLEAIEELKRRRTPYASERRRSEYTVVVDGGGPMIKVGGQFQYTKNAPVRGIFLEAMTLRAADADRDFNLWYNDERVPSVLAPGIFHSAYRYRGFSPSGPTSAYVCIYETDRADVENALKRNRVLAAEQEIEHDIFPHAELAWEMTAFRIWPLEGR